MSEKSEMQQLENNINNRFNNLDNILDNRFNNLDKILDNRFNNIDKILDDSHIELSNNINSIKDLLEKHLSCDAAK